MSALSLPLFNRDFKPLTAILVLTFAFGSLDILDSLFFWGLSADVGPLDVLQGIASGLLGSDAYHGGLPTAVFGLLLQYCGFFCLLGIGYMFAARLPVFGDRPMAFGLGYGLASFVIIHYVILPLTAFHIVAGFYPGVFANTLLSQTVFIGLPCALLAGAWAMGGGRKLAAEPEDVGEVSASR